MFPFVFCARPSTSAKLEAREFYSRSSQKNLEAAGDKVRKIPHGLVNRWIGIRKKTTCRIPLAACARTVGRHFPGRPPRERVQPGARIPAPEQLPNEGQRNNLGGYGVGPLYVEFAFAQ